METVGGISVEEMKGYGLSDADIAFIQDKGATFKQIISKKVSVPQDAASVVEIAINVFEQGLSLGIAKARGLSEVAKRIGF